MPPGIGYGGGGFVGPAMGRMMGSFQRAGIPSGGPGGVAAPAVGRRPPQGQPPQQLWQGQAQMPQPAAPPQASIQPLRQPAAPQPMPQPQLPPPPGQGGLDLAAAVRQLQQGPPPQLQSMQQAMGAGGGFIQPMPQPDALPAAAMQARGMGGFGPMTQPQQPFFGRMAPGFFGGFGGYQF